nr:T-complex protein 1 subunit delta [Ipomoea batatas]
MVSELAGEGAIPLPAPASHAELRRVRLQSQIRRGSLLRRGVTRSKQEDRSMTSNSSQKDRIVTPQRSNAELRGVRISSFNLLFLQFSKDRSVVLFSQSSQSSVSWSRSVKVLSKVLTNPPSSVFNRTSWSRSVNRSSTVLVNPQFIAFNWSFRSRSVEITSRALVNQPIACVAENNQSSFWILCVLTATVYCISTGFADKSKRREAPNVTPTERSPAIPITVQSSLAKDRIGNTKPSDQQRSPGRLKLSSTKLSSICFIRSLECGKYPSMFVSRGIVLLSQKSVTDNEINQFNVETKENVEFLRIEMPIDNLNSSYGSAEIAYDSESVSSGSVLFLTRSLVMVFVYECYTYPTYECFKAVELNKLDIQQLRLIEMQMLSVVLRFAARFEFDRDDWKILFNMINDLNRIEKAKNVVIQFQISSSKTDIEQSIVVYDYTQMDRILKEEISTLIKSCSDAKGSVTDGEKEDLVDLEEHLLKLRFQSLHQNNGYISSTFEYNGEVLAVMAKSLLAKCVVDCMRFGY